MARKHVLERFLLYRTYHGSAMAVQNQWVSTIAWQDEAHVISNRKLYTEKYDVFMNILEDIWPMKLFQYGQVLFPTGSNDGPFLWLTPQGTERDQISLAYRIR